MEDMIAAKPLDLASVKLTFSDFALMTLIKNEVFVAAYYLYRRRGIFLSTGEGTSNRENIIAALKLAMGRHADSKDNSELANVDEAMLLIEKESLRRKRLGMKTWENMVRFDAQSMSRSCPAICQQTILVQSTFRKFTGRWVGGGRTNSRPITGPR